MAMTQAILPQFRERGSGVVVDVTSSVTLARMPLVAVYTASKTAIEGFTASLALELEAFDVRVKLVEPGYGPTTRSRATASRTWRASSASPPALTPWRSPRSAERGGVQLGDLDRAQQVGRGRADQREGERRRGTLRKTTVGQD
jgi:short-subunit dehydrogenase